MKRQCRKCRADLTDQNWFDSFQKSNNRICSPCHREATADARARYAKTNAVAIGERAAKRPKSERTRAQNLEAVKRYRAANLEKCREAQRERDRKNPEIRRARTARRRAMTTLTDLSAEERQRVVGLFSLASMLTRLTGRAFEVDHVVPLAKGGAHHPDNMVVMRADYNRRKHARRWLEVEQHFLASG